MDLHDPRSEYRGLAALGGVQRASLTFLPPWAVPERRRDQGAGRWDHNPGAHLVLVAHGRFVAVAASSRVSVRVRSVPGAGSGTAFCKSAVSTPDPPPQGWGHPLLPAAWWVVAPPRSIKRFVAG